MHYGRFNRDTYPFLEQPQTEAEMFVAEVVRLFEAWCRDTTQIWRPQSRLLVTDFGEVYMRRTRKPLSAYQCAIECITFARVEIDEAYRSKGLYSLLVDTINGYADVHGVGVVHENTHEPRLAAKWELAGYYAETDFAPTFVRLPKGMRNAARNRNTANCKH